MKSHYFLNAIICLILLSLASSLLAQQSEESLIQSYTFAAGEGEWRIAQAQSTSADAGYDDAISHTGDRSFRISSPSPGSVTIQSEPLDLEVGHLYRLSGWIRTDAVTSDPTARYPTALPACLSMYSFPFTNNSPAVGATSNWQKVETLFIATKSTDHVQLHLGRNGTATGSAWFDDIRVEKVEDIEEYIPLETVTWFGDAYRYDDCGWIFVHVEGEPYERGYQYGYLVGEEIVQYMTKLGVQQNRGDLVSGWQTMRFMADSMLLRKYDEEYLTEMRGIADGCNRAGVRFNGRELDLIDIVTINSAIDLGQMQRALGTTAHALSGRNFLRTEEEMLMQDTYNKCSSFIATGSTTTDGRFVFGQIFMWGGYTGVHWDVLIDIDPAQGHRFVMHSFPGGIHSGADFYINEAGIVIGETTVSQTPYNADGTPQSNRIRKAIQYASTFEEVAEILSTDNNGMYTNDWTLANAQTDEGGVFLLGTEKNRLWRTGSEGHAADTPGNLEDFIWANNNNRDPEVRTEYLPHPENAPYDLIFKPANRDIAFQEFYRTHKDGKIDSIAAVDLWATSPINRAHACDGKITTGEMADRLVFLAHYGKTTLREKMVGDRFIADLPTAEPHLTLGYSVASPIFITEKLQQARAKADGREERIETGTQCHKTLEEALTFDKQRLWQNTVYPASAAENWFISATAKYWQVLRELPESAGEARNYLTDYLAENNDHYCYLVMREGDLAPVDTSRVYDRYNHYDIPRIKGTTLLHQLRLQMGNDAFAVLMNTIHDNWREQKFSTADFISTVNNISGSNMTAFITQWLDREGLPQPMVEVGEITNSADGYRVPVHVKQAKLPYSFITDVSFEGKQGSYHRMIRVEGEETEHVFTLPEKPLRVIFNSGYHVPLPRENCFVMGNVIDEFQQTTIVHGTRRQLEANHTMAKNWCFNLAEAYVEILMPVVKDCEVTNEILTSQDLIVMGSPSENSLMARLAEEKLIPVHFGKNMFTWEGITYTDPDDGLVVVMPNPWNGERILYLFIANSQMQMHEMTGHYRRGMAEWTLFSGDRIVDGGYLPDQRYVVNIATE